MGNSTAIFWPVMAQILLIYAIYILVSVRRIGAIKAGKAKPADFKTPFVEPEASAVAVRNLSNQFELPVLFFAASISLYVTGGAGLPR
ncbi:MAPEG family protein [Hoeflea sp.]|uniref:MAPEG family protein n=1 Tax=Hoeflea sp. TaxID=1940281 RepID=UPI003BA915B8